MPFLQPALIFEIVECTAPNASPPPCLKKQLLCSLAPNYTKMIKRESWRLFMLILALTSFFIIVAFLNQAVVSLKRPYQKTENLVWGSRRDQVQTLMVTFARSGSSFTSDIIANNEEVFFTYEPLSFLSRANEAFNVPMHFQTTHLEYFSRRVLESYLTCSFDFDTYKAMINKHLHETSSTRDFFWCFKTSKIGIDHLNCYFKLLRKCRNHRMTFLKTIRFPVKWAQDLMARYPKLKLLYLVRDPRASLNSQAGVFKRFMLPRDVTNVSSLHCHWLGQDLVHLGQLRDMFPDRVKVVRYEHGATDPYGYAVEIYDFLGLAVNKNLTNYVRNLTSPKERHGKDKRLDTSKSDESDSQIKNVGSGKNKPPPSKPDQSRKTKPPNKAVETKKVDPPTNKAVKPGKADPPPNKAVETMKTDSPPNKAVETMKTDSPPNKAVETGKADPSSNKAVVAVKTNSGQNKAVETMKTDSPPNKAVETGKADPSSNKAVETGRADQPPNKAVETAKIDQQPYKSVETGKADPPPDPQRNKVVEKMKADPPPKKAVERVKADPPSSKAVETGKADPPPNKAVGTEKADPLRNKAVETGKADPPPNKAVETVKFDQQPNKGVETVKADPEPNKAIESVKIDPPPNKAVETVKADQPLNKVIQTKKVEPTKIENEVAKVRYNRLKRDINTRRKRRKQATKISPLLPKPDPYSTHRDDPMEAMEHWRHEIGFPAAREIDRHCGHLYQQLGYRAVSTKEDLENTADISLVDFPEVEDIV
ncbi:hypothetical protein RRG08_053875 [Elysia crispata]|uniref:Sulfotransferase domain-containing protein n=1 Tax=Elysia crispata TaxID=231223 RepID=A0AAE0YLK3_9GAST|nr:hypothetical protein RRG08_053875 [Elysia crispata]